MSDLISRERLKMKLQVWIEECEMELDHKTANIFRDCIGLIDNQPTINPDNLVKHGEWIPEKFSDGFTEYTNYWCSVCDRKLIGCSDPKEAPYCHCGAKMDGGKENE